MAGHQQQSSTLYSFDSLLAEQAHDAALGLLSLAGHCVLGLAGSVLDGIDVVLAFVASRMRRGVAILHLKTVRERQDRLNGQITDFDSVVLARDRLICPDGHGYCRMSGRQVLLSANTSREHESH